MPSFNRIAACVLVLGLCEPAGAARRQVIRNSMFEEKAGTHSTADGLVTGGDPDRCELPGDGGRGCDFGMKCISRSRGTKCACVEDIGGRLMKKCGDLTPSVSRPQDPVPQKKAFEIDTRVEAQSLVGSASLNCLHGTVTGFKGDRVVVDFDEESVGREKALKPSNLKILSTLADFKISDKVETHCLSTLILNGKQGVVTGFQEDRVLVKFDGTNFGEKAVPPSKLTIVVELNLDDFRNRCSEVGDWGTACQAQGPDYKCAANGASCSCLKASGRNAQHCFEAGISYEYKQIPPNYADPFPKGLTFRMNMSGGPSFVKK